MNSDKDCPICGLSLSHDMRVHRELAVEAQLRYLREQNRCVVCANRLPHGELAQYQHDKIVAEALCDGLKERKS